MNPGELKDKIKVLTLTNIDNSYIWSEEAAIWSKCEQQNGTNIFSKVGIGAKSLKLIIRKRGITLHNAFTWKGLHCFLTDINEIDRLFIEVTAALIEPKVCTIKRTAEPTYNSLNRPVYSEPTLTTFPGILTEKYLGNIESNPMTTIKTNYILVTPKVISLQVGELIKIESVSYEITLSHTLDEYKNEYEIISKGDA